MQSGTHETFNRTEDARGSSDRSFGLVFAGFFAILSLWPLFHGRPVRLWGLAISAAFSLSAVTAPGLLHPFNWLWTRLGLLISKITNPIITGLMFYLIFMPAGYLFRFLGKDLLRLRLDPDAASYWIPRQPPGPSADSVRHQF